MSEDKEQYKTDKPKHAGGRPPEFETPEQLQIIVDKYLDHCKSTPEKPTIAGLAYYTGLDRKTIYNYEKKDEFFHIIKKARDFILYRLEVLMCDEGKAGQIFTAKQYGYVDKQDMNIGGQAETPLIVINRNKDQNNTSNN